MSLLPRSAASVLGWQNLPRRPACISLCRDSSVFSEEGVLLCGRGLSLMHCLAWQGQNGGASAGGVGGTAERTSDSSEVLATGEALQLTV